MPSFFIEISLFPYDTSLHLSIFAIVLQKLHTKLELTGSFVAIACAVHCISIPILVSVGSLGAVQLFDHLIVEVAFLLATMIIAGWSLFTSYKKGMVNARPIVFFILGFSALIFSIIFHLHFLSAVGGIAIAAAHLINWRQLRTN